MTRTVRKSVQLNLQNIARSNQSNAK